MATNPCLRAHLRNWTWRCDGRFAPDCTGLAAGGAAGAVLGGRESGTRGLRGLSSWPAKRRSRGLEGCRVPRRSPDLRRTAGTFGLRGGLCFLSAAVTVELVRHGRHQLDVERATEDRLALVGTAELVAVALGVLSALDARVVVVRDRVITRRRTGGQKERHAPQGDQVRGKQVRFMVPPTKLVTCRDTGQLRHPRPAIGAVRAQIAAVVQGTGSAIVAFPVASGCARRVADARH